MADAAYSEAELLAWEVNLATSNHFNGHQVLDYGLLLQEGIKGLLNRIDTHLAQAADPEARIFYESLAQSFRGTADFIRRHADLAAQRQNEPGCPADEHARLARIEALCRAGADRRPQSFAEGLSLLWFFIGFADYDSAGRFDQYLYPLYRRSRDAGMSRQEARSLQVDFWQMLDANGAILNMTVGATRRDGTSQVNELTWLVLEVTRELGLKGTNLCLRMGRHEPDALWDAVHTSLAAGQALPALYNEEQIVPMLLREGIAPEDAWDFCLAGCSQVVIPGKSSFACDIGTYNTLKCLELALHDASTSGSASRSARHSRTPDSLDSYEAVYAAYQAQTAHAIQVGVSINNKDHTWRTEIASCIRSALTADCLTLGRPLFSGGARYYAVQNEVVGLTNTANALQAIRQVVFREERVTLTDLVAILDRDYDGAEALRLYLRNQVAKFGNGSAEVDRLRAQITQDFFSRLAAHPAPLGGRHWPGEVIFHYHVTLGQTTLASADGRKSGEPFADSAVPAQGTDRQGILGIFQSDAFGSSHHTGLPNTCCCLNLKFDSWLLAAGTTALIQALQTYLPTGFRSRSTSWTRQTWRMPWSIPKTIVHWWSGSAATALIVMLTPRSSETSSPGRPSASCSTERLEAFHDTPADFDQCGRRQALLVTGLPWQGTPDAVRAAPAAGRRPALPRLVRGAHLLAGRFCPLADGACPPAGRRPGHPAGNRAAGCSTVRAAVVLRSGKWLLVHLAERTKNPIDRFADGQWPCRSNGRLGCQSGRNQPGRAAVPPGSQPCRPSSY